MEQNVVATRAFMAVLTALEQTGFPLQELTASTELAVLMNPNVEAFGRALRSLRKLNLEVILRRSEMCSSQLDSMLNWDRENATATIYDPISCSRFFSGQNPAGTLSFGEFLAHATSLRELKLRIDEQSGMGYVVQKTFQNMVQQLPLTRFVLPHLTSLTLDNIRFAADDLLLPIIAHGAILRRLELHRPSLLHSDREDDLMTWPLFFKRFRKHIRQGTVVLEKLVLAGEFSLIKLPGDYPWEYNWQIGAATHLNPELGKGVADFVLGLTSECIWHWGDGMFGIRARDGHCRKITISDEAEDSEYEFQAVHPELVQDIEAEDPWCNFG